MKIDRTFCLHRNSEHDESVVFFSDDLNSAHTSRFWICQKVSSQIKVQNHKMQTSVYRVETYFSDEGREGKLRYFRTKVGARLFLMAYP